MYGAPATTLAQVFNRFVVLIYRHEHGFAVVHVATISLRVIHAVRANIPFYG